MADGLTLVLGFVLMAQATAQPKGTRHAAPVGRSQALVFSCSPSNDLYRLVANLSGPPPRYATAAAAVRQAPPHAGVLVLADRYPNHPTAIAATTYVLAAQKHLRLYVEYPAFVPNIAIGPAKKGHFERVVVASDFFGPKLPRLRIASVNALHFLPVTAPAADLVAARVAGFDTAVYGLPKKTFPILFEPVRGQVLVATTKLSQFITARYGPSPAWHIIWKRILHWLQPSEPALTLNWQPSVRPTYGPHEVLPADAEAQALHRGLAWFKDSKLLPTAARVQAARRYVAGSGEAPPPPLDAPIGDGSQGIEQCYLSQIRLDGRQPISIIRRGDCVCESAMAFAFGGHVEQQPADSAIARNLLDYWYFQSPARKGGRGDPKNPAYGLIAWGVSSPAWMVANYGDDNARVLLGTWAAAALTGQNRWDRATLLCVLANLRTSGRLGFRHDRIDMGPLEQAGWQHYFRESYINYAPHYEAYLWACFLWAYQQTGDLLFLHRAETAIRMTMRAYPAHWRWTNGLAQEKARMLLPLAWLVRVADTPEHRAWLRRIAKDVIALQVPCGAIREELGPPGQGAAPPPRSNAAYGTAEASLLQRNGDPVCDLLYTVNFAFLGLHEAAAATGNPLYIRAENRLANFLCRIQIKSKQHPELNGGWFRAFDFRQWDYWGSNSDLGWGAWAIETGWTQAWICSVFALRQMDTSLWNLTQRIHVKKLYPALRQEMIPAAALRPPKRKQVQDAARGTRYTSRTDFSPNYPGGGAHPLTDGFLASKDYLNSGWQGYLGDNLDVTIDLGAAIPIHVLRARFLQSVKVGIFLPRTVQFAVGNNPGNLKTIDTVTNTISPHLTGPLIQSFGLTNVNRTARYVRVRATNLGVIPRWHPAAGRPAWLFVDELIVNPGHTH